MLQPYPYQDATIEALCNSTSLSTYLALEQGLGKTMIAIRAAARLEAQRILLCTPALGRIVWPAEYAAGWIDPDSIELRIATRPSDVASTSRWPTAILVTMDMLSRKDHTAWLRACRAWRPDTVIIDEAHRLGHEEAQRTKTLYGPRCDRNGGIIEFAERVWPMSGTPCPNHTAELWPWLRACVPDAISSPVHHRPLALHEFQDRYSITRTNEWGRVVVGSVRSLELREAIGTRMIRLRKTDVRQDMPPCSYLATRIDLPVLSEPVMQSLAGAYADLDDDAFFDLIATEETAGNGNLANERHRLGLTKLPGVLAWINDWFAQADPDAKLIVFARHLDVVNGLHAGCMGLGFDVVSIQGATPTPGRNDAVQRFQFDRRTRLFVGQINTCSEMITLTAASTVVLAETEFVPGVIQQAAARAHRIGQKSPVLVHLLTVANTLDERINRIAARKARGVDLFFGETGEKSVAEIGA